MVFFYMNNLKGQASDVTGVIAIITLFMVVIVGAVVVSVMSAAIPQNTVHTNETLINISSCWVGTGYNCTNGVISIDNTTYFISELIVWNGTAPAATQMTEKETYMANTTGGVYLMQNISGNTSESTILVSYTHNQFPASAQGSIDTTESNASTGLQLTAILGLIMTMALIIAAVVLVTTRRA